MNASGKFLRDSYSETFDNMVDLLDRLAEIEDESKWLEDIEIRHLRVHALEKGEELPMEHRGQESMSEEIVEDTLQNTGLYLTLPGGEAYCLREQGRGSVHSRAGITGNAYVRLPRKTTARHLNDGLASVGIGKKCYVRISGGKILGVHSSEYQPCNMLEAFSAASEWLALQYPEATFQGAVMNHDGVTARFDFSAYAEELFSDIKNLLRANIVLPSLQISMGDSAKAAISVLPEIYLDTLKVPLGNPISNKHRGVDDPLKKFRQSLLLVQGQFERQIINLRELSKIPIAYPLDCYFNMAEQIGLSRNWVKATAQCAEMFNVLRVFPAMEAGETMTALDVYLGLCEVIPYVVAETANKAAASGNEADSSLVEARITPIVARALKANWQATDYPKIETVKGGNLV